MSLCSEKLLALIVLQKLFSLGHPCRQENDEDAPTSNDGRGLQGREVIGILPLEI